MFVCVVVVGGDVGVVVVLVLVLVLVFILLLVVLVLVLLLVVLVVVLVSVAVGRSSHATKTTDRSQHQHKMHVWQVNLKHHLTYVLLPQVDRKRGRHAISQNWVRCFFCYLLPSCVSI